MTSTNTKDYTEFAGKKVTVVRNLPEANENGDMSVEVEGTVQVSNELGILLKPKGKVTFDLIPIAEIEDIFVKPEEAKDLKASKLKLIEADKVKRHLLDRHGYTLAWVNSVTDEVALEHHETLDHSPIGHVHVAEESAPEEEPEA